jgi:hypothetical protein
VGANFWLWWNGETTKPLYQWETDIVEFVSLPGRPHTITFNEHYGIPDPLHPGDDIVYNYNPFNSYLPSPDFSQFHTMAVLWTPEYTKYYLDGNHLNTSTFFAAEKEAMRILLDINVFTGAEEINATTLMPYQYEIDYVRVYTLKRDHCSTVFTGCNPFLMAPSIYKKVSLGGLGCSYKLPAGSRKDIWASELIELKEGFEVEKDGVLSLNMIPCFKQTITECNAPGTTDCNVCPD